jgi:hypothetical protein
VPPLNRYGVGTLLPALHLAPIVLYAAGASRRRAQLVVCCVGNKSGNPVRIRMSGPYPDPFVGLNPLVVEGSSGKRSPLVVIALLDPS